MGEYATRKSDRERIKIGTCSEMYYLRFEDRHKVSAEPNSVDVARHPEDLRFRLPFPDEDNIQPGDYDKHNRGLRLYRQVKSRTTAPDYCEDFTDAKTASEPGNIQLRHDCGLLLNVPCYHGHKLPDVAEGMKAFWNGKGHFLELSSLRTVKDDAGEVHVFPVVACRHCMGAWRYQWAEVMEYIERPMRERLEVYVAAQEAV